MIFGRGLVEDDCPTRRPVAIVSERGWSTRFGSDPAVVGRMLRLNNQNVVAEAGYRAIDLLCSAINSFGLAADHAFAHTPVLTARRAIIARQ
jgi:hypothetical protein